MPVKTIIVIFSVDSESTDLSLDKKDYISAYLIKKSIGPTWSLKKFISIKSMDSESKLDNMMIVFK